MNKAILHHCKICGAKSGQYCFTLEFGYPPIPGKLERIIHKTRAIDYCQYLHDYEEYKAQEPGRKLMWSMQLDAGTLRMPSSSSMFNEYTGKTDYRFCWKIII